MKILVAGMGVIGQYIAKYLSQEQDMNVFVIDKDSEVIKAITDSENMAGIVGDITSIDTMINAGITSTEMFIAATDIDEENILSCVLADVYDVSYKISIITNPKYLEDRWEELFRLNKIPVDDVISPWLSLINILNAKIKYNYLQIADIMEFNNEEVKIFSLLVQNDSLVLDKTIKEIEDSASSDNIVFKIVGIYRNDSVMVPSDETTIHVKDKVFVATINDNLDESYCIFHNMEDIENKMLTSIDPNIIIYGNNKYKNKIAISLSKNYGKIKVVSNKDSEEEHTKNAIELEPYKIKYIKDDITKADYRNNYFKNSEDIIIIVNEKDEETLLTTLLLKDQEINNIFCCLESNKYDSFLLSNNIYNSITINSVILSSILSNLRVGLIYNVYSLYGSAEVIEIEIMANSNIVGKAVEEVSLKGYLKIAHIIDENNNVLKFNDYTILQSGYKIIYIANRKYIKEIEEKLFSQNSFE